MSSPHSHGKNVLVNAIFGQWCGSSQGQPSTVTSIEFALMTTAVHASIFYALSRPALVGSPLSDAHGEHT